jgi:hypothetical protein
VQHPGAEGQPRSRCGQGDVAGRGRPADQQRGGGGGAFAAIEELFACGGDQDHRRCRHRGLSQRRQILLGQFPHAHAGRGRILHARLHEGGAGGYIGQEHKEGIPDFATIDLDKDNYKYDPAYVQISINEINNKTDFSFISSFGTQLDIVDRNDDDIEKNKAILQTIKSTRVRLTTLSNEYLNIFGVFIYGPDGNILNKDSKYAYSSSNLANAYPASNAMKIVKENLNRKAFNAIQNTNLINKRIGWNNWNQSSQYATHTNNDNTGTNGGAWWEYEFDEPIEISLIEIFGRTDCCPNRNKLRIDLFDDSKSRTKVIWTNKFNDMAYDAHKTVKITK